MNLTEKLSLNEYETIAAIIADCGFESEFHANSDYAISRRSPEKLADLLGEWAKNKEELYKLFNGNLILSRQIEINKDTALFEEEFKMVFNPRNYCFYYDFMHKMYDAEAGSCFYALMDWNALISNTYQAASCVVYINEDKKINVRHGCKVSKVIGKLAAALDVKGYEDFRIAHSQALNQKHLYGTLCLSIHPLDYITMSDNSNSWSSCMSWDEHGSWRQGTIEMMNSPKVIVAYLKSDNEDYYINADYSWNSKKWRELFIVDEDIITSIKGYPYQSEELSKIVIDWLTELNNENKMYADSDYSLDIIPFDSSQLTVEDEDKYFTFKTRYMYNDFGSTTHYARINLRAPNQKRIEYSGASQCICCGTLNPYFLDEGALCCEACDEVYYCDCCGEPIRQYEEMTVTGNDMRVCDWCLSNECFTDVADEEIYPYNNGAEIHLATKDDEGNLHMSYDTFWTYEDNCFVGNFSDVFKKGIRKTGIDKYFPPYYYVLVEDFIDFDNDFDRFFEYMYRYKDVEAVREHIIKDSCFVESPEKVA